MGKTVEVPVKASFDTYVSAWHVVFIYPDGLTPINFRGKNIHSSCDKNSFIYLDYSNSYDSNYWSPGEYEDLFFLSLEVSNEYDFKSEITVKSKTAMRYDPILNELPCRPITDDDRERSDINQDSIINVTDISSLIHLVLSDRVTNIHSDLNRDGVIDLVDIVALSDMLFVGEGCLGYENLVSIASPTFEKKPVPNGSEGNSVRSASIALCELNDVNDYTNVTIKNDAIVLGQNGHYLFLKDSDCGYGRIYGNFSKNYEIGDVIPAGYGGQKMTYQGYPELSNPTNLRGMIDNVGEILEPNMITPSQVGPDTWGQYVLLDNVVIDKTHKTLSANGETCPYYDYPFQIEMPTDGQPLKVYGIISNYFDIYQVLPISIDDNPCADKFKINGICYQVISDNEVLIYRHHEAGVFSLNIPHKVLHNGRTFEVVSIGNDAFSDCAEIISLSIPMVAAIGNNAFSGCTNLMSLTCNAIEPPSLGTNVFSQVPSDMVVFVPLISVEAYQSANGWNAFEILPMDDGHHILSVSLPENVDVQDYANMRLEVNNIENNQTLCFTLTDKPTYKFTVESNSTWNVTLTNQYGDQFGKIENVVIGEESVAVTFSSLLKPQDVSLAVKKPNGQDVTDACRISWFDEDGELLLQGNPIKKLPAERKLKYQVTLPQDLATAFTLPSMNTYTVKEGNNDITCQLSAIGEAQLSGKVKDATNNQLLYGATISAVQSFGGGTSHTITARTDNQGQYSLEASTVPTTLTIAATGYISQTIDCDMVSGGSTFTVPDVALSPITGAVVNINLTYTPAHAEGEAADTQNWYSDYSNVDYEVYNKITNCAISDIHVQYPQIVLLEDVNDGDVLELTATSRKNAFKPVKTTVTIAEQKATATFNIKELGKVTATFNRNINPKVTGSLYDAENKLVKTADYSGRTQTIDKLPDGNYTLVTMGKSDFFNSIYDLEQFAAAGLTVGDDYVKNEVQVNSSIISQVSIDEVPFFDESKFYYTGDHTSFIVNKPNIVIGNYLTFRVQVDFKDEFVSKVNDVQLIIDLPESCSFIDNSVLISTSLGGYTIQGNRLIISLSMAELMNVVRFCAIPTVAGDFAPSALVKFELNGKTITQPIGNAQFTAKGLSINVPTTVAKTTIPVSGTAIGQCNIDIYDNDILIGQTSSLANGIWSTKCELYGAYNLSSHNIYAVARTKDGLELRTETVSCLYNKDICQPKKITMSFYNGWMEKTVTTVFDFENGTTNPSSYSFYTATDFTFVADLTNNDPTVVSGVTLYIYTDENEVRELVANYDENLDKWVAVSHFDSNNLPVNIGISIHSNESTYADRGQFNLLANRVDEKREDAKETLNHIDELEEAINAIDQQMTIDEEIFAGLEDQINNATDNDEMNQLLVLWLSQAGLESSIEDFDVETPETVDGQYIQTLITKAQELLDSSDYSDHSEEIETLLEQVNESLQDDDDRFDYMASLWSAQSDTIIVDTENGTATLFRTTLEKYGDIPFEIADTIHIEMTDNSTVYIYISTEDEVIIVDSLNNCVWYVNDQIVAQEVVKSCLLRAKGDFVAAMETARQKLMWLGNTVLSAVQGWINEQEAERAAQEALRNSLEQQQAVLLGENAGLQIRINEIEKELQALTTPDVITVEEYFDIVERDELVNQLKLERENVLKKIKANRVNINKLTQGITRCGARIVAVTAVLGQLYELYQVGEGIFKTVSYVSTAIQDHGHWHSLINNILPCKADQERAVALKARCESDWSDIAWSKGYYPAFTITALTTVVNGYMMTNKAAKIVAQVLISAITDFLNNTAEALFNNARSASLNWYPIRYAEYRSLKCKEDKNEPDKPDNSDDKKRPPLPPTEPIRDPSGFVYEGVPSNRLQGVTVTCYYKETVEDMYGDTHEEVVLWDAEQYGQQNPLLTDANGYYRWDVPIGMWQVKYEKEGYETTYSDWLPVPPPQLDVNIGMVQMRQPEVIKARAYPQAVEFEFDKFMFPEMLNSNNITVTVNGSPVSGTIELLNAEVDDPLAITSIRRAPGTGLTFASKVRFNANSPFNADKVTLHVKKDVKSYADLEMYEDYEAVLDVELEIQSIEADSTVKILYGDCRELTVTVLPANASRGKTLSVRSVAPMIATTDAETYTIDNSGKAVIAVHGDLPGSTSLLYSIEDYDLTASTLVKVMMENQMTVAIPTATIASGSEVEKGTAVYLHCATEGATIFYTLDGSCPCDLSPARKVYDGSPIIINSTVTIKAMATAPDLYDSEVATFVYRVVGGKKGDVNGDGEVNIADVNAVIDIILGGQADADTRYRADVNGDGEVNIADINAVIDIILNPAANMMLKVNCDDLLHMDDVTMKPGDVRTLQVTVDHAAHYSALQCDIVLPAGLTLMDVYAPGANTVKTGGINDNTCRALNYSMARLPFVGDTQPVMTFTVRADAALAPESEISLTNAVLADAGNKAWRVSDCTARVNNASGINDMTATVDRVWVEGRTLFIESRQDGTAQLAMINGMVSNIPLKVGINRQRLDRGIYIVVVNGQSHKIAIK